MNQMKGLCCFFMLMFILTACGTPKNSADRQQNEQADETSSLEDSHSEKAGSDRKVHVNMINTEGEEIGTATLEQETDGVNIAIDVSGLSKGTHGFHIHEKGMCEPPTFESAGGHFNPTHMEHGFDNPEGPHAGDLPNLEVGEDGKVQESFLNERVTLKKGEANALLREGGTSLVIHEDADDNLSQPAGDSGARIACGVIGE
jgi:Cu-Zn family superoxide dismutase